MAATARRPTWLCCSPAPFRQNCPLAMKLFLMPLALLVAPCVGMAAAPNSSPVSAAAPLNFETHVRPILRAYCLDCHGAGEQAEAELDLRLRRLILKGGE